MTRALIIGFVCFIIAVAGLYYLSLTEEQSNRQYQEIYGSVSSNSDGIGAIGLLLVIIVGFFALMIAAGALTTLASASYWDRRGDVFRASALAGGTPVMLLWIIFWCLIIANIILGILKHDSFGYSDLTFLAYALGVNVIMIGLGALIAGVSGHATRALAWRAVRMSG
jgi:hypothetical protein